MRYRHIAAKAEGVHKAEGSVTNIGNYRISADTGICNLKNFELRFVYIMGYEPYITGGARYSLERSGKILFQYDVLLCWYDIAQAIIQCHINKGIPQFICIGRSAQKLHKSSHIKYIVLIGIGDHRKNDCAVYGIATQ